MTGSNSSTGLPAVQAIDPRIEPSRVAILQAAVEELAEVGYGQVRMEPVAARAGVARREDRPRKWPKLAASEWTLHLGRLQIGLAT